jgi:osmotically-inducible protein OsmY
MDEKAILPGSWMNARPYRRRTAPLQGRHRRALPRMPVVVGAPPDDYECLAQTTPGTPAMQALDSCALQSRRRACTAEWRHAMDKDRMLQRKVISELEWEPAVESADIGVAVVDGVVTLNGFVKSYAEKLAAEKAVRRIAGANAIAEELKVRYASDAKTADHEIAKRILDMFAWNSLIPKDTIQVKVEHGWVSLTGEAKWQYQSREAARVASQIGGVTGVSNRIRIDNPVNLGDIRKRIEDAFERQADLDARGVIISVDGNKVTLGGHVAAWHERQAAERAAWAAPGVTQVIDHIAVS